MQDEPDESHPAENRRVGGAMTGRDRQPVPGVARAPDGIPLSFEVHGSGTPALVLVHGWSCDRRYWRGQLDAFADRHQVVAVDLAGHGESGGGRQRWTMAAFGDDVAAVVRHLRLGDVVLVGHSMGGDVAVETALRLGGQVLGVVWADTYDTLGDPPTREELEEFVARSGRTSSPRPEPSSGGSPVQPVATWSSGWRPTCRPPLPRSRST